MNREPKKHHYVPRLILKNFCFGTKNTIYVLDKKRGHVFTSSLEDTASENYFYNDRNANHEKNTETKLGELENLSVPIFDRINSEESLLHLTAYERGIICLFVAVQMLRTNNNRESMLKMNRAICDWVRRSGYDPNKDVEDFKEMSKVDAKQFSIAMLRTAAGQFAKTLFAKDYCLIKAHKLASFYTSDNPVTMYNNFPRPGRGNLGLALKGIEIHFPISPKLCLTFMCSQTVDEIRTRVNRYRALKASGIYCPVDMSEPEMFVDQFDKRIVRELRPENMEFHNSLQVSQSSRFLYSQNNDFELAKDMLRANPELKEPASCLSI